MKKLLLSKPRGFCAGVDRAIESVEKALQLFGPPIYVRHQIVHNRFVVERLENKGAIFIEDLKEVPDGSRLIYSAHGVAPSVREEAKKKGLYEIDATCGLVTRVHSAVDRFAKKGYQVILIGHKNHVEIMGTKGVAPLVTTVVETVADVASLSLSKEVKIFYTTQTTLSLDDVSEITEALLKKYPQAETLPTSSICYATTNRQMALSEIRGETDLILVVGDPKSSNSNRLREVGARRSVPSYLITEAADIEPCWVEKATIIGLTAGASTPEDIVQGCIARLEELGVTSKEEVIFTEEHVIFELPKNIR